MQNLGSGPTVFPLDSSTHWTSMRLTLAGTRGALGQRPELSRVDVEPAERGIALAVPASRCRLRLPSL